MDTDVTEALANLNIFDGLDQDHLAVLAERFRVVESPQGEVLVREGQRGKNLFVVLDGEVRVFLPEDSGPGGRVTEVELTTLGPGDLIGEYAFVDMRPASASVATIRNSRLLRIDYGDLHRVLSDHCSIARRFYENLLLVLIDRLRSEQRELDMFSAS